MKRITELDFYNLSTKEQKNFTGIVKWNNGDIEYYKNGKWHREDGPAIIYFDGYQEWCLEGKLHNLNGPAIIYSDGREEYWINGKQITKEAVELYADLLKLKKLSPQTF
jgi:hypothetical protein